LHRTQVVILGLLLVVLCFSIPAAAFVPEEGELNTKVLAAYRGLKSWQATVSFDDESGLTARVWYSAGKWRQEWQVGGGNGTAAAVGVGGKVFASCPGGGAPLPVLAYWQPPQPVRTWKELGMDNATAGFGFCDEAPCFIFGAEPGDDVRSQVRLNNETMALLFMRLDNAGRPLQFSFGDYATFKGFEFPGKGTLTFEDGTTVSFSMIWNEINRAGDPKLYSPDVFSMNHSGKACGMMSPLYRRLRDEFSFISASQ